MYFGNPNDICDVFNKAADINNCFVDNEKQEIKDEISLLWENRHNPNALRKYILNHYSENNFIVRVSYAKQLQLSSAEKLYNMAELKANRLYCQLKNLDTCKIDNRPLKVIIEELKAFGQ